jgi:hypothetical protein
MRLIGKVLVFLFSLVHWLVMGIIGAHVNVARNLVARDPDADRPRQVRRG